MSQSSNKFLLLNKPLGIDWYSAGRICLVAFFASHCQNISCQITNFVNNGSFENVITNTATPLFYSATYWGATDSSKAYGEVLSATTPPVKVPVSSYTYQWPKHGNNHMISLQFCSTCPSNKRGYPRNRLKQSLKPNTTYCFSMYVNLSNESSYAIDAIGAFFGDTSLDTITSCNVALTYLYPQIENAFNNVITDTLGWTLVQGQYTAKGTERYVVIGNFRSDSSTNKILVNTAQLPAKFSSYLIDNVSVIALDLPAFAGRDTVVFAGDSLFLGREPDVGIDEACTWFKLPGTIPIDTIAGFWVKPTETCTYIVRQEICGLVKWDTVRIYMDAVGIERLKTLNEQVMIFPNPADHVLNIIHPGKNIDERCRLRIVNHLGALVLENELTFRTNVESLNITDLRSGVYLLQLTEETGIVSRKFVVDR